MHHNENHMEHSNGAAVQCPSMMVFHAGHCELILVKSWIASTLFEFILSACVFFLLALFYEYLRYVRECIYNDATLTVPNTIVVRQKIVPEVCVLPNREPCHKKEAQAPRNSYCHNLLNKPHLIKTLLHTIQVVISYLLMLVFMTFNYWLCLAIIIGYALGYFCFGWIKRKSFNADCCN